MSDVLNLDDTRVVEKESKCKAEIVREEIAEIRMKKDPKGRVISENSKRVKIFNKIKEHLNDKNTGEFYVDDALYYYRLKDHTVSRIDDKCFETAFLFESEFDILPADPIYKFILETISLSRHLFKTQKTKLKKSAYYCKKTNVTYISVGNKEVFKITCNGIEETYNGVDNIVFKNDDLFHISEFKYIEDTGHDLLINEALEGSYKSDDKYSEIDVKRLINAWVLSFFFPELSDTKLILVAYGEKGSFKTTLTEKIGWLFFGEKFSASELTDDLNTQITNATYLAMDNVETKASTTFLDKLARIATGLKIQKRKLYFTNKMEEYEVQLNMAISAMTPNFRRPDVVERLLLVEMERKDDVMFTGKSKLKNDFLNNRNRYMSCIVNQIKSILRQIKENSENPLYTTSLFRMGDFATFLKYVEQSPSEGEYLLDKLLVKQGEYSTEFVILPDLLDYLLRDTSNNQINGMITTELHKRLKEKSQEIHLDYKFSHISLGMELKKNKGVYEKRFGMEKTVTNKGTRYSFYLKD
jgi:hypothetical protein